MEEKNKWGRPFGSYKYNPEQLFEKAKEYFKKCEETIISYDKATLKTITKPKTLSWLCLWLWVAKDYISEKAKDESYSETIKQIRLEVENSIEEWILQGSYNPTSWIFNLKNNFDWKDKTEVDSNVKWELSIWWILQELSNKRPNLKN